MRWVKGYHERLPRSKGSCALLHGGLVLVGGHERMERIQRLGLDETLSF